MNLERGMVVLIRFPLTNLERSKVRPALVLSSKTFNRGDEVVLAAISSQKNMHVFSVDIEQKDLTKGILHKKSYVKCGRLLTMEKRLIFRIIGIVSSKKLKEARNKILTIL